MNDDSHFSELVGKVIRAQSGTVQQCAENGREWNTAYQKTAITGTVSVGFKGIVGDERTGFDWDRALCCHPVEHYKFWRAYYRKPFSIGLFGENLTLQGFLDEDLCIGDIMQMGTAVAQITQPRTPCWKQAHYTGEPDFVKRIEQTGRRGWMMRVLEEGELMAGDPVTIIERPHPDAVLSFINRKFFDKKDLETAQWITELAAIGEEYRDHFSSFLSRREA